MINGTTCNTCELKCHANYIRGSNRASVLQTQTTCSPSVTHIDNHLTSFHTYSITISGRTCLTVVKHTFRFLVLVCRIRFSHWFSILTVSQYFKLFQRYPETQESPAKLPSYSIVIISRRHANHPLLANILGRDNTMHSWQPHHSRTPPNLSLKLHPQADEQSRSIKHDRQAFFLEARKCGCIHTVLCRVHLDTLKTKKLCTQLQYTAHCTSAGCLFYSYTWLLHSRNTISETAATSGNHATISNLKTAEFPFQFNVMDVVVRVLDTKQIVRTTMISSPWNSITMNRSHHRSKQPFSRLRFQYGCTLAL